MCLIGNMELLAHSAGDSGLISHHGGCLMGFLEWPQELGVYSRVTAWMAIRNSNLFSKVRTPVRLGRTHQESKLGLAG